jgi:CRP-like cAMP-binding protein
MLAASLRRYGDLPESEVDKLRRLFQIARVPRHTLLLRAGEPPGDVMFIVRGLVRLFYVSESGVERTNSFRSEGQLACSYSTALRTTVSDQFVETLEDCTLLVAPHDAFVDRWAGHPCWEPIMRRVTERLFLEEERRHRDLLMHDATTRYRRFVADRPKLARRLTQRQIAAYIGIAPESLSRIRATLTWVNAGLTRDT